MEILPIKRRSRLLLRVIREPSRFPWTFMRGIEVFTARRIWICVLLRALRLNVFLRGVAGGIQKGYNTRKASPSKGGSVFVLVSRVGSQFCFVVEGWRG